MILILLMKFDTPLIKTKFIKRYKRFIVDYKGYRVGVGSGLSDSERKDFWQRKESLLGVKIEMITLLLVL